jgi:fibronectin-binding autotransporter adhesin
VVAGTTSQASGSSVYAFSQVGGTGILFANAKPVVTATTPGANNIVFPNTVVNNGLIQYTFTAPGGAGNNAGNSWAWVASPNTSAAIAPLTSILSSIASIDASFHQSASALVASPKSTEPNKLLCGPWSRGSAGYSNVSSTGSSTFSGTTTSVASHIYTGFDGYQAGFDCGLLNFMATDWNVHIGGTGGQIWATSTERLASPSTINFSVPFYGVYGVATYGSFFTDLTYRHSNYDMHVTNAAAGLQQAAFNGSSDALHGSVGYLQRFDSWFIEPSGALSYTRGTFDTLQTFNALGSPVGQLTFDTLQSLLGRVGVRAGVANQVGDMVFTPFVTGAVWHEFEGDSQGAFVQGSSVAPMSVTRVGTFYQAGLGITGQAAVGGVGLIGFIRTDVRFGADLNGAAVIAGGRVTF